MNMFHKINMMYFRLKQWKVQYEPEYFVNQIEYNKSTYFCISKVTYHNVIINTAVDTKI